MSRERNNQPKMRHAYPTLEGVGHPTAYAPAIYRLCGQPFRLHYYVKELTFKFPKKRNFRVRCTLFVGNHGGGRGIRGLENPLGGYLWILG